MMINNLNLAFSATPAALFRNNIWVPAFRSTTTSISISISSSSSFLPPLASSPRFFSTHLHKSHLPASRPSPFTSQPHPKTQSQPGYTHRPCTSLVSSLQNVQNIPTPNESFSLYTMNSGTKVKDLPPLPSITIKEWPPATDPWNHSAILLALYDTRAKDSKQPYVSISDTHIKALDDALGGILSQVIQDAKFTAVSGASTTVRVFIKDSKLKHVALYGLGTSPDLQQTPTKNDMDASIKLHDYTKTNVSKYLNLGKLLTNTAKSAQAAAAASSNNKDGQQDASAVSDQNHVALVLPQNFFTTTEAPDLDPAQKLRLIAQEAINASFKDTRFQKSPSSNNNNNASQKQDDDNAAATTTSSCKDPLHMAIMVPTSSSATLQPAVQDGVALAQGVLTAKHLVNLPPNVCNPPYLAALAQELAKEGNLDCKILERDDCDRLGMGAYLAVAQGSVYPPKFLHLTYTPEDGHFDKKIVLIGKGLTFDSGGYNLKTGVGSMIELMKFDMGGCAAVLGAAKAISLLKPQRIQVHFISATCENMINENALRPGDIITASDGTTIEVINTDAEGRLTLADALIYGENLGDVDYMVDMATLTGAIIIALGNDFAGYWSNNPQLESAIESASTSSNELVWKLPLPPHMLELTKSKLADLKNVGTRAGSSTQAALFLNEFVKKTKWAHIDIAGTVWKGDGPTGYGVHLLVNLVKQLSTPASS